jgi:hypothetical protein
MRRMIGDAGKHIGEPRLRVDVVHFCCDNEAIHFRGPLSAAVGPGEQPWAAAKRNWGAILPISAEKLSSTIDGTLCMAARSASFTLNGDLDERSPSSRVNLAWRLSSLPGCLIRSLAQRWLWALRPSIFSVWPIFICCWRVWDSAEHALMLPPSRRFIMRSPLHPTVLSKQPRQFVMPLDPPVLSGMTSTDRNAAIRRLARILMEAAGLEPEEIGNDECW